MLTIFDNDKNRFQRKGILKAYEGSLEGRKISNTKRKGIKEKIDKGGAAGAGERVLLSRNHVLMLHHHTKNPWVILLRIVEIFQNSRLQPAIKVGGNDIVIFQKKACF